MDAGGLETSAGAGWVCPSSEEDEVLPDQQQSEDGDGEEQEAFETDPKRLLARQKQIDYGKNTLSYERYLAAVPKHQRRRLGRNHDPPTPDITAKMSKKSWDGIVKAWRRHLHKYDDEPSHGGSIQQQGGGTAAAPQQPQAPAPARGHGGRGRHSRRRRQQAGSRGAAGPAGSRQHKQQQDQGEGRQQQQHARSSQGAGGRSCDAARPQHAPGCEEHAGRSASPAAGHGSRQGAHSSLTPAKRKAASQHREGSRPVR